MRQAEVLPSVWPHPVQSHPARLTLSRAAHPFDMICRLTGEFAF